MENQESKIKKSIVLSGLVGTGGLFVAKLIGIIYAIPFSSILGNESYMSIYGQAYNIYSYLLMVFTAGFPFAIATLVARYTVLNDHKTVLLVKKIAISSLALMGFAGMVVLMFLSGIIAPLMVAENIQIMANVLRFLAIAIFLVPVLSAFRGYYQGLKEMQEYAFSQAFEQLFRVGFLLAGACIVVYLLGFDRKYALYISVLSTSVAALAGIAQIFFFDRKKKFEVEELAQNQEGNPVETKLLVKEYVKLSIPYLLTSIFGYSQQIYNAILLPLGLKLHNYSTTVITSIISATTYVGVKITAIPMVLAPGFTAAIIPHITAALTIKDYKLVRKSIIDCINIILFIGLPVSFCIFLYAKPINYVLFYSEDLETASFVLAWLSIEAFLGTLAPVVTNLMMSLELKKSLLKRLIFFTVVKGIIMVPLVWLLGFVGSVLCNLVGDGLLILFNIREIKEVYKVNFKNCFIVAIRVCIAMIAMWIVCTLLNIIGINGYTGGKLVAFIKMCINGLLTVGAFVGASIALKLPEAVFHVNFITMINGFLHKE